MVRGLMTDEGCAFFAPFPIENRSRAGARRLIIAGRSMRCSGSRGQARPGATFRRRPATGTRCSGGSVAGRRRPAVWHVILAALGESEAADNALQTPDSTIVRAHRHAAGGRGGVIATALAVRAVGSRPGSTPERTRKASASACI